MALFVTGTQFALDRTPRTLATDKHVRKVAKDISKRKYSKSNKTTILFLVTQPKTAREADNEADWEDGKETPKRRKKVWKNAAKTHKVQPGTYSKEDCVIGCFVIALREKHKCKAGCGMQPACLLLDEQHLLLTPAMLEIWACKRYRELLQNRNANADSNKDGNNVFPLEDNKGDITL